MEEGGRDGEGGDGWSVSDNAVAGFQDSRIRIPVSLGQQGIGIVGGGMIDERRYEYLYSTG